jgi:hypothetical protein
LNILYLNDLGKVSKQSVLHVKQENIWDVAVGAKIIYLNIFYLNHLWGNIKTPSFENKVENQGCQGCCKNNLVEYLILAPPRAI